MRFCKYLVFRCAGVVQILKAHKQEDGDRGGKRIASEAGRRYIMTPAGTSGSAAGGGRGSGAPRKEPSTAGEGAQASFSSFFFLSLKVKQDLKERCPPAQTSHNSMR